MNFRLASGPELTLWKIEQKLETLHLSLKTDFQKIILSVHFRLASRPELTGLSLGTMPKRKVGIGRRTDNNKRVRKHRYMQDNAQPTRLPPAWQYNEPTFRNHMNIGPMTIRCSHCAAMKFSGETPGLCCHDGKITLPTPPLPPQYLRSLYFNTNADSEHFLENIRSYNNAFTMTSFGGNIRRLPGWNPTFTIQGQVCHRIGSIEAQANQPPKFLQVYFFENQQRELQTRLARGQSLRPHIVEQLSKSLNDHNEYVRSLKNATEFIRTREDDLQIVIHEDKTPKNHILDVITLQQAAVCAY